MPRKQVHGKGFIMSPRRGTKFAREVIAENPEAVAMLRRVLNSDAELDPPDHEEVRFALTLLGIDAYHESRSDAEKVEQMRQSWRDKSLKSGLEEFKEKYGSYPPSIDFVKGKVGANCVTNAFAQLRVLQEIGAKDMGVLCMPTHIVPTVKIRGKRYVMDNLFLHDGGDVKELQEYLAELRRAHGDKTHQLHKLANGISSKKNPKVREFAGKFNYYPGMWGLGGTEHVNRAINAHNADKFKEALLNIDFAEEMLGDVQEPHLHRARTLERMGRNEDAIASWKRALSYGKNAREIRRHIRDLLSKRKD